MNKELYYYLTWLGYTKKEVTRAINYYNEFHTINTIDKIQLPLAVGKLVQIINQLHHH